MRFLDTLSLHVCISGQTTYQKGLWMKKHGIKEEGDPAITGMIVTCQIVHSSFLLVYF